jgi:sugar phosphate isomerase/epimerase
VKGISKQLDKDDYGRFFKALKQSGYKERISIEVVTIDFVGDAAVSLELLKKML